jgi:ABC-type dipeptide/oligopeptide/nickel transport system permease subunit
MSVVPAPAWPRWSLRAATFTGAGMLLAVLAAALLAPVLAPHSPLAIVAEPARLPGPAHRLGTNTLGQDLLSQWLYGARASLAIGFLAAALSTVLSATLGVASAAWRKGGGGLLALIDLFLAVPAVPMLVLFVVFLGPGFWPLVAVLALVGWAPFARIVRAQTLVALKRDHVEAARALGAPGPRLFRRGILPEIAPILFTKFLLTVRWAVLLEATLGLLGLGDPARVTWGLMLHQAFAYPLLFVTDAWIWWAVPPAIAIAFTSIGLAAVGQDLDIWLNPHAAPRREPRPRASSW